MISKNKTITIKGSAITIMQSNGMDFISLTDMVRGFGDDSMIYYWMRNRNTVEFIGIWEELYNPHFKGGEFATFKTQAGLNNFHLTPRKWIEATNAIGFISKAGRYGGGTFAHKDIAFEFGSWLSSEFKLYLIKEFQRLKEQEANHLALEWNLQRTLAKINYKVHTDAIKAQLIPPELTKRQITVTYATEADLLNVALFGMTAKAWRDKYPELDGNIRDHASIEQLIVLSNLESINAALIHQQLTQEQRIQQLNNLAILQMQSLLGNPTVKQLT